MPHPDDGSIAWPQIFTMHWEGPEQAVEAPASDEVDEDDGARVGRRERADALWQEIRSEAHQRGNAALWDRKLAAYRYVKLDARGNAAAFARAEGLNHATVRSWIHEVGRLAYRVGYRLHEDRLLLVGHAHPDLDRLRRLVHEDAGTEAAWRELERVAPRFRGEDPYFHLNEGHVLRARGALVASDEALKEGLALAEARPVRALLWNARGQTFWDCGPQSGAPLEDHLARAERAFRRAVILDQGTWFAFANLTELAVDAHDRRRAEYWVGELAAARKGMGDALRDDLARYLHQAPWAEAVESTRFWRSGPLRWIAEAGRKGVLALLVGAGIALFATSPPVHAASTSPDTVAHGGKQSARGGAGGN